MFADSLTFWWVCSLVDGVGERRTQNLPGTGEDEYPNWKMPLCDGSGDPVLVEDLPQQRPPY